MECILGCHYILMKASKGERKIQFQKNMDCISVYCIYFWLKTPLGRVWNTALQEYECILDCKYLLLKTPVGESKIQFHKDMNVFLSLFISYWRFRRGEHRIQFHRGMGCILDCNYLLLRALLGRESNTVTQGYGMYFRLYLSLCGKFRWGESQIQIHKDMNCVLDCSYLLLKTPQGSLVENSAWESLLRAPQGRA